MNKLYTLTVAATLIAGTALAQSHGSHGALRQKANPDTRGPSIPQTSADRGATIWYNDFSDPSDWVIANDGPFPLDWQIGIGLTGTGDYPTPPIESTTASNGYAMLDSDGGNNGTIDLESSHITTSDPIDLSLFPNVILQFENQYRKYNNEQCYVVVSTNNTDWPLLEPTTDISGMPNVYYVWQPDGELISGVSPGNPTVKRINISASAGGHSQVWIRFHWTGLWGYTWFVDDVSVEEQAQYDIAMLNGTLSHTGTGDQYGRIPSVQLNPTFFMGGEYSNIGVQDQTNVQVTADAVAFSASTSSALMATDETILMDESVTLPALANGLYTATFNVTSDQIASDGFPANNTYLRTMEVTDYVYSLDGIGNHPPGYEYLTDTGTDTYVGETDGLFLFTLYHINSSLTVYGVEVMLASGTVAGGTVIASLHDTTSVLGDDPGSTIALSAEHEVTQAEVDAGMMVIPFSSPEVLAAGAYYAGLELYSNGGTTQVIVLDDNTVIQPVWSSCINTPSDGLTYENGNAYAIRLTSDPAIGMAEMAALEGVSLYPNPANDLVTISFATPDDYRVEVLNVLGEIVMADRCNAKATMEVSGLSKGAYTVRVSNEKAMATQPLVIY